MQNSTAAWIPGVAGQSHTRKINPAGSLTGAALPPRAAPNPLPCSSLLLPCARSLSRSKQHFGSTPGWFGALAPSPENFCSQLSPSSSPSHLGTLFAQTNALGPTREPPVPAVHGTAVPMPHGAAAHGEGALGLGAGSASHQGPGCAGRRRRAEPRCSRCQLSGGRKQLVLSSH